MPSPTILAIDQGTTSSRAIIFDSQENILSVAQQEFPQIYPDNGWVEHDPEDIWQTTLAVCRSAIDKAQAARDAQVAAIGITNQRETVVIWDRESGQPIYNAIVWQDRRTAELCRQLHSEGLESTITAKTGLLIDPYFSATKIRWILDNVAGAQQRAEAGKLAFGTIDSFLLWRLSGGKSHATDATNACRTMLFNLQEQQWDEELMARFGIPQALMPKVCDSADDFGSTDPTLLGAAIPITGIAGDQQAASIGQACVSPGMIKSTYGTGCFALLNTGEQPVFSRHRLLSTVAYRLKGKPSFCLEGAIFVAGSAVKWLRDGLGIIQQAAETESLARQLSSNKGVYLVPAFTGLGAPHWDPHARGAILGMTLDTGPAELARATLEAMAYQTRDLAVAMGDDGADPPQTLRVDGGMAANDWMLQFLADILAVTVERPRIIETTALGAAYLAGLQIGLFNGFDEITERWQCERRFTPTLTESQRAQLLDGWHQAIARVRSA